MEHDAQVFDYLPKTIRSGASVFLGKEILYPNFFHSICYVTIDNKKYLAIHQYVRNLPIYGNPKHEISYLDDNFNIIKSTITYIPDIDFDYAIMLDENTFLLYNAHYIYLYSDGKSNLIIEKLHIYFRLDDDQNIIIIYDIIYDDNDIKYKMIKLEKQIGYLFKEELAKDYTMKYGKIGKRTYENLLFIDELNDTIINYYYFLESNYIVFIKYYDKINIYDIIIHDAHWDIFYIDRWTFKENKWSKSLIMSVKEDFYKLNMFFDRQIFANYYCSKYNFGSIVSENYSDWCRRMLDLLKVSILKLSSDVLGLIIDYVSSV